MAKRTGIAMVAAGAVLILCALLLLMHNRREDAYAGQEAESLLANVEAAILAQVTDGLAATAPNRSDLVGVQRFDFLNAVDVDDTIHVRKRDDISC